MQLHAEDPLAKAIVPAPAEILNFGKLRHSSRILIAPETYAVESRSRPYLDDARDFAFLDCPLLLRPVVPFCDPFFAVLADALKSFLLGAPFAPGLRIFSLLPLAMRFRFALMLA